MRTSIGGANMPATQGNWSTLVVPDEAGASGAESDLSSAPAETSNSQRWDRIIDYRLIEWGRDASSQADDGVEPPSAEVIHRAIELAKNLKERGVPAPDVVVPDPNGGIVFELRGGETVETLHIWDDDERIEYCQFQGARLVERKIL